MRSKKSTEIKYYLGTTAPWVMKRLKKHIGNDMKYVKFMLIVWDGGSNEYAGSIHVKRFEKDCVHRTVGWKIYIVSESAQ